ncbi:MAG TPA: metallophosphoesterase family protein [Chitinophagaceae bacterium]|jgi:hypothetical protein
MKKIGLLSDTHGFLDPAVFTQFSECDEVWHAGDFGSPGLVDKLALFKPLKGVYGNIDDTSIRTRFAETLVFECENIKVMMQHIGGYPPRYDPATRIVLMKEKPKLFIAGHSHILKIQFDAALDCLYINPGAAGRHGWHKMRTIVRFAIDGDQIKNCEVIELGSRSATPSAGSEF